VRAGGVGLAGLLAQLLAPSNVSAEHLQAVVFLTTALALVGQAFLVGVLSPRDQWARLGSGPIWLAVTVSLGLLAVAVYVPGLRGALDLKQANAVDWSVAVGWAAGAWAIGQVISVVRYHRRSFSRL
jgi:hypothetical protein